MSKQSPLRLPVTAPVTVGGTPIVTKSTYQLPGEPTVTIPEAGTAGLSVTKKEKS